MTMQVFVKQRRLEFNEKVKLGGVYNSSIFSRIKSIEHTFDI